MTTHTCNYCIIWSSNGNHWLIKKTNVSLHTYFRQLHAAKLCCRNEVVPKGTSPPNSFPNELCHATSARHLKNLSVSISISGRRCCNIKPDFYLAKGLKGEWSPTRNNETKCDWLPGAIRQEAQKRARGAESKSNPVRLCSN